MHQGKQTRKISREDGTRATELLQLIHYIFWLSIFTNVCGRLPKKNFFESKNFLAASGIVHQRICPYTSKQNGVAERANRTIIERVRCMLINSGLNHQFCAEAANTACFLINRVPCRKEKCSPERKWIGRRPSIKFLRVCYGVHSDVR